MVDTGTQTSTTVIAPIVKKHWQWRSTGLYHQLVREEEEEASDQEASPLARKCKEEVVEVIQEAETTPSLIQATSKIRRQASILLPSAQMGCRRG